METTSLISLSPSFNSYSSSENLADIAARVIGEFSAQDSDDPYDYAYAPAPPEDDDYIFNYNPPQQPQQLKQQEEQEPKNDDDDEDEDFEFAVVCTEPDSSPISADEIFYNGQIRPVFPLFNRDLLLGHPDFEDSKQKPPARLSLRKLFSEERDSPSCSSSEADDLDGIPAGTYCVWTPKSAADESPGRCKKSHSTGNSSKRWKFRDLLHRSNSDRKDSFVFFTPSIQKKRSNDNSTVDKKDDKRMENVNAMKAVNGALSATVARSNSVNGATKEDDRRRSLLPYKQDLVGLLANVNGLSRNVRPF